MNDRCKAIPPRPFPRCFCFAPGRCWGAPPSSTNVVICHGINNPQLIRHDRCTTPLKLPANCTRAGEDMTKNRYRILVAMSFILFHLSARIDSIFGLLAYPYSGRHPAPLDGETILFLVLTILGAIAGLYGSMRFLSWAPMLNLITAACFLAFILSSQMVFISSSWAQALTLIATASWGVALALPFIDDNVGRMFKSKPD